MDRLARVRPAGERFVELVGLWQHVASWVAPLRPDGRAASSESSSQASSLDHQGNARHSEVTIGETGSDTHSSYRSTRRNGAG